MNRTTKHVTNEEFEAFKDNYPRPMKARVRTISDQLIYMDNTLGAYPDCVVCGHSIYTGEPTHCFIVERA